MTGEIEIKKPKAKKKRKIASLDKRKARVGWLFVLPFIIGFLCIYLPIITKSIWYSFNHLQIIPAGGFTLEFVGFKNYQEALFTDAGFLQTLISGIGELIIDIPAILLFSLFMAVLLNQKMVGRGAFRAIFFLPVILATGFMTSLDIMNTVGDSMGGGIDDGSGGSASEDIVSAIDLEALFSNMKVGTELVEYVVKMINKIYSIVNRSGVQMLIFLSGLQSISPAIYEACKIDGASGWETFWKITFPMISPMILVNAVYTIIDSFTAESNVVMSFISGIYQQANGNVVSSAMSWMYFLIVIAIIAIVAAVFSAFVFYQRRD